MRRWGRPGLRSVSKRSASAGPVLSTRACLRMGRNLATLGHSLTSRFSVKLSFPFRNSRINRCGRSLHVGFQTTRCRQRAARHRVASVRRELKRSSTEWPLHSILLEFASMKAACRFDCTVDFRTWRRAEGRTFRTLLQYPSPDTHCSVTRKYLMSAVDNFSLFSYHRNNTTLFPCTS